MANWRIASASKVARRAKRSPTRNRRSGVIAPSFMSAKERATDDQSLDVARAFVDLAHAHVPIDTLNREVRNITVAAVDLDGVGGDFLCHLRGKELRHRRFLEARLAGVTERRRVPDHLPGDVDLRRHVSEAKGDRLMFGDRLAER